MNAQIIAIGSELLTPDRMDTNSLFLTAELNRIGVEVTAKYIVGDDRDRLASMIRQAMGQSEFVILSGGLGPTEDDVTRDAVSFATGRRLVLHPEIVQSLEARFRSFNRVMPEINKRQAYVLEGAEVLPNDRGSAPGQWLDIGNTSLILLPGPPHEIKAMYTRQCAARVERRAPKLAIETLVLRISGMTESELDQLIAPVYKNYDNPATTILAHGGDLQVHLRARCATRPEAAALVAEVGGRIDLLLGNRIYSRNGDSLEVTLACEMTRRGATLCVAESATGGGLASRITSVPGSSAFFLGGFVTYSRLLKTSLLGVPEAILDEFGPVSKETCEAMARGARIRTASTYALAITGNAGPGADGDTAPVGTMFVSLADVAGVTTIHRVLPSDRERNRQFAVQMALDLLRRHLLNA